MTKGVETLGLITDQTSSRNKRMKNLTLFESCQHVKGVRRYRVDSKFEIESVKSQDTRMDGMRLFDQNGYF